MNGQSYGVAPGLKSLNGTAPNPNSYPASLSSQSSRDTSPSRLTANLNHLPPDKSITSPNIPPYKYIEPGYNSAPGIPDYGQQNSDSYSNRSPAYPYSQNTLQPKSTPQNKATPAPHMGYASPLSPSQASPLSPTSAGGVNTVSQRTNMAYQQNNPYKNDAPEDPVYSNIGPGLIARHKSELLNSYPYSKEDLDGNYPNENNKYPPTYGPNYSGQPSYNQTTARPRDQPITSGPPRTNALGIIPYTTEGVTSVAKSTSSTPSMAQHPTNPIYSNVTSTVNSSISYTQPQFQQQQQPPPQYQQQSYAGQTGYNQPPQQLPNYHQPNYLPQSNYQQQISNYPVQAPPTSYPLQNSYSSQNSYPMMQTSQSYPKMLNTAPVSPLKPLPTQNQAPLYQQVGVSGSYPQVGYRHTNDDLSHQMSNLSVTNAGYNHLWGRDTVDLLKSKDVLPPTKVEPPPIRLQHELYESSNCSPELFRCTLTKIPETKSLLDKSRLPLGVLIHPFKDLNQLSVIQCSVIVRCRSCRTYINPFVYFVDTKHWKCNLCFRVNELPDEFQYDPLTKTFGDPSRRPEIKSATIEFIAPSEYMVRPPQPAAYVFVMDVSRVACESSYLQVMCDTLLDQLEALPGDARTSVAFITYDSTVHYYSLAETQSQPHQMVVVDVDDMFVPSPDNLLVNLSECLILIRDLLKELPNKFKESFDTGSALGAALQAAYKLLAPTGGRVTVFTSSLVTKGPGSLSPREDPTQRSGDNISQVLLNPITDFYKKQALDCSGQQVAVDLFILNSQFVDLATISGISRFSGGCIHHFPLFSMKNQHMVEMFHRTLQRYLTRKIGFESVMRLRCTRGLSIHTFHGNFFVRSTDLLSLPNINPDSGFGMQVSIEENLSDIQNVCFQAALLYTSSKGERRIRVHTLCLPIASNLSDVLHGADQQCIIGLLSKMAVDRCHQSSLADAREAFVNVVSDVLSVFKVTQSSSSPTSLLAPINLSLLPLYILALLKYTAFRIGQSTRLDDRVFAMCQMKSLPLSQLILAIYPDLYPVHNLQNYPEISIGDDVVVQPPRLHLSSERIECTGIYLMDDGESIMLYVGHNVPPHIIKAIFDVPSFAAIDPNGDLPEIKTPESERLRAFISYLQNEKPVSPIVQIIRNDMPQKQKFLERLVEDKTEAGHSYYEFLQNVKVYVK